MQKHSLNNIANMDEKEVKAAVKTTGYPHPIAITKFEALDWNIKHELWHCGQIAIINRVVDQRYEL